MPTDQKPILDSEKLVMGAASRLLERILAVAEEKLRTEWARRKNRQLKGLSNLIANQVDIYSKVKNILYYNDPVPLNDIYIPLDLQHGDSSFQDAAIFESVKHGGRRLVIATAGAGKSFFMKKALLELSKLREDIFPIFFEMRNLNGTSRRLIEALHDHIRLYVPDLMPEQLRLGMEQGLFVLLLDGFDEVEPEKTDQIQNELIALARSFPKTAIIVSSRPMDIVLSWQDFQILSVNPLSKASALLLVERLAFDKSIKERFIDAIKDDLYDKHESFLSVPLLVTMMLITFAETADIDSNLTTFYSDAFNAILVRHDARKEAFRRKIVSGLSREEFKRAFALTCSPTSLQS
jgi:predicted NACHT family NTPase